MELLWTMRPQRALREIGAAAVNFAEPDPTFTRVGQKSQAGGWLGAAPGSLPDVLQFGVGQSPNHRLERVLDQLRLYEHPLLDFSARSKGEGVEVIIQFKNPGIPVHTYYFALHPRDLDHPQFEWSFQRQLYDCLHDYLIEMFTRTPQNRAERQGEGL